MATEYDKCRRCGESIEWGRWATSGKAMPLDAYPNPDGKLVLVAGTSRFERRTCHFDNCKGGS